MLKSLPLVGRLDIYKDSCRILYMDIQILKQTDSILEVLVDGKRMVSKQPSHSSRQVYKFKDFVVKVSTSAQNRNEIEFYTKVLKEEDAKYFPKLIAHGKFGKQTFLVQEKVMDRAKKAKPHHVREFEVLQSKYRLSDTDVSEYYLCNAAISRGQLKIYDIGYRQHQW